MRRLPPLLLLLLVLLSRPAMAQRMDLRPEVPSATLGDAVTFLVTVEISPGQELLETAPRVMLNVPDGVRLLGIDTLRGAGDRIWRGKLRLAFYRVGEQPVPILGLLYRARPGGAPDTLLGPSLRMSSRRWRRRGIPSSRTSSRSFRSSGLPGVRSPDCLR